MIFRTPDNNSGVSYLQFPNLASFPELFHGVFTRSGGISHGCFQGLNVSRSVGDRPDRVQHNRQLVSRCMEKADLAFTQQVHGNQVVIVSGHSNPSQGATHLSAPPVGDAMATDIPGKALVIQVADCQPVLLYDPIHKIVANVHSGWRGSIGNIVGETVKAMKRRFSVHPDEIRAGIGPSLGPCCAEFINYQREIPQEYWKYKSKDNYFDFWAMSRDQLIQAGVSKKNIHVSGLCTKCRTDLFFSFRAEKTTGRFAAVIGVNSSAH